MGLCTLPTDMKFIPTCPEDREMSLVRTAPQARSMIWRASAASARFLSGSARLSKADSTSPFVRALNLALLTRVRSAPASRTVSIPMSSPSRSKSVAMMISSAFDARLLIIPRMDFTLTVFTWCA